MCEPSERAIEAAWAVAPEYFQEVRPYGGVMAPSIAREDVERMLRAAYATDFGAQPQR